MKRLKLKIRYSNVSKNTTKLSFFVFYALFAIFLLSGCAAPGKLPGKKILPAAKINHFIAGKSVQNQKIECLKIGNGKNTLLFMASIHGDETQGTPIAIKLAEYLQENPQLLKNKKVVILPQVNPDGVILKQRFNANGVDLNRNFPADNRNNSAESGAFALCEPEARIINKIIKKYKPKIIISLHQPSGAKPGWIDYDGEAKGLAEQMAKSCNLEVYKYGAMPGSLGSYASQRLGIPIITFEQTRQENADKEILWQKYGNALLAVIKDQE